MFAKKKVFHSSRFRRKWFLISIDATGIGIFNEGHCNQCLHQTSKKGKKTYFHNVLDAKLVTPNGFSISVATEWIENSEDDYNKQDCELKAFKRLSKTLKIYYPKLPLCILADSLYPSQEFFETCKKNRWSFILTFKEGKIPSISKEAEALWDLNKNNTFNELVKRNGKIKIEKEFRWVNGIEYGGQKLNWVECIETKINQENGEEKVTRFVHLSNLSVDRNTVQSITFTGRLRWKIENEGFNCQKNQGYNLEHKYSRVSNTAMKNYYCCLQIAHLINQLIILSKSFQNKLKGIMTIKYLWSYLIGFLNHDLIDEEKLTKIKNKKSQIRFCT